MCKDGGGLPRFQVKADVAQTMEQMMQALMSRGQSGQGKGGTGGSGGGMGGSGQDGYSVAGQSANIPVYGPDRLAFSDASGRSGGQGTKGGAGNTIARQQPRNQVKPDQHRDPEHSKLLPENIPNKYQNAVKRYFSQDSEPAKNSTTTPITSP